MERSTRRITGALLAAAALGAITGTTTLQTAAGSQPSATERAQTNANTANKGAFNLMAAEDTRGLYGGGFMAPGRRRPWGKRYRASVRQHQRHASKARNRKAAR